MVAALFLAAALQAATPAVQQAEICTLVTPRGDAVRFAAMAWSTDGRQLGVIPTAGSAWPREAIVGARNVADRSTIGARRFVFGDADGLVFEFGMRLTGHPVRTATLSRNAGGGPGLPLAFGYCARGPAPDAADALDTTTQPDAAGAGIPAFDPSLWPARDCAMLLGDDRRIRLRFQLRGTDRVELTSPDLWSGRPVMADFRWLDGTAGLFDHAGGPTGTAIRYPSGAAASIVKLLRFDHIGGDAPGGLIGYAICGAAATISVEGAE